MRGANDVSVQLGLQTAPVLLFFPPTAGPHAVASPEPLRYDFTSGSVLTLSYTAHALLT